MPPKKETKSKEAKARAAAAGGGKGRKKKWSKGKARDKLNNAVMLDKATYEKLLKEVPTYKLISCSVVSDRLKVRGSVARRSIALLLEKGLIREVVKHSAQSIYTRATAPADEA
eukprot:TRINITY_DN2013_c0_g1_i2.p3 TRINITY_DN2013_c0_g1~~TRINITY_DN2013_c0_g1_i2.p3  ORF type:complete len:114 (+),score=31.46 TRINITY_DN2013_c0_g1_i2:3-344(+)